MSFRLVPKSNELVQRNSRYIAVTHSGPEVLFQEDLRRDEIRG